MFTNLCRLLHGMVDAHGNGLPFTMRDVALCLKAIGNRNEAWQRALRLLPRTARSTRRRRREVVSQVDRLGHEIHKVLSGLVGAVDKFQAPLVNAYAPDIVMRDVLEQNLSSTSSSPPTSSRSRRPRSGRSS